MVRSSLPARSSLKLACFIASTLDLACFPFISGDAICRHDARNCRDKTRSIDGGVSKAGPSTNHSEDLSLIAPKTVYAFAPQFLFNCGIQDYGNLNSLTFVPPTMTPLKSSLGVHIQNPPMESADNFSSAEIWQLGTEQLVEGLWQPLDLGEAGSSRQTNLDPSFWGFGFKGEVRHGEQKGWDVLRAEASFCLTRPGLEGLGCSRVLRLCWVILASHSWHHASGKKDIGFSARQTIPCRCHWYST